MSVFVAWVFMCVCRCVFLSVHICTVCIHLSVYMCICMCVFLSLRVCMYVFMCTCVFVCMYYVGDGAEDNLRPYS